MHMTALQELHKSMKSIGSDMQQFQVTLGAAEFDCLFSTREAPFVLALTSRGLNPRFFKFDVITGYWIRPHFGDLYGQMVEVLRSGANTGVKLKPSVFFEQLNGLIPDTARADRNPSTAEIVRLRADITEDRDKPYFDTWIYWKDKRYKDAPSSENKAKTAALIGPDALKYSLSLKASSKWSSVDLGNDWVSQQP